jgi:hypothetical protein
VARAVSALETVDGKLMKLRFADRGKSLEALGRHLGMDNRELAITRGESEPLRVIVRSVLQDPADVEEKRIESANNRGDHFAAKPGHGLVN